MNLNKIKISEDLTQKLRTLKSRTGLTPNILCRIGICLSLREPGCPPNPDADENGMEFNRYTLTGEYDTLFLSLLKEKNLQEGVRNDESTTKTFINHIYRGVFLLYNRVKSLSDMSYLIEN
jgi:DNA sulfur modification protein DndE